MKKIIVAFFALTLISASAFAQSKGSKFLGVSAAFSYDHLKTTAPGYGSTYEASASATQFAAGVELGYFLTDDIALSFTVSVPYYDQGDTSGYGVNFAPSVTKFSKISEGFYYSPSVTVAFETGKVESGSKVNYTGYGVGVDLLGFTFRIKDNLSLYVKLAPISYMHTKAGDAKSDQFSLKLNSGSLGLRFDL